MGIIAAVGFAIGILWPRLAGVKLVPSAPVEEGETVAAAEPAPTGSGSEAPEPALAKAAPVAEEPEQPKVEPSVADRVKISEPKITSCRDNKGFKVPECPALELDKVTKARIQTLGACTGAEKAHGTLSLGLELDFGKRKITDVVSGKSTTLPDREAKALIECAKREFESASLDGVEHARASYTVFYMVELLPPSEVKPGAAEAEPGADGEADVGEVTAASGRATVSWQVAMIRDKPKDGEVVARILSGTRVVVTGRQQDWYRIKYDAKGNEGWVFGAAIGM